MDEPTIDNCSLCGSAQTSLKVKRISEGGIDVVEVSRYCKMCRRDVVTWKGTQNEYKRQAFIKKRIAAQLAAQARSLGS